MEENSVIGYVLVAIGVSLVVLALSKTSINVQLALSLTGFLSAFVGLVMMRFNEKQRVERGKESGGLKYLRPLGSLMVLFSTALPYLPLPLEHGKTREAYSFVDLIYAVSTGAEVEGGITLLIFVAVVFAGASASLLHYSGGYVILFGVAGYTYVVSLLMDMGVLRVFLTEFRAGIYLTTAGALLIILSPLVRHGLREKPTRHKGHRLIHQRRSDRRQYGRKSTDEDGGSRDTGGPVTSFET